MAVDGDGRLMGFQFVQPKPGLPDGTGDIATFVRIGTAQRGIGTALFARTRGAAAALGYTALNATIRADNTGGLRYYARIGFADHSISRAVPLRRRNPGGPGEPAAGAVIRHHRSRSGLKR